MNIKLWQTAIFYKIFLLYLKDYKTNNIRIVYYDYTRVMKYEFINLRIFFLVSIFEVYLSYFAL